MIESSKPVKLNNVELEEMAILMANAFANHQNWVYTIPKIKRRVKALKHIFKMMYRIVNEYGYIFTVVKDNQTIGYITYMDVIEKKDITLKRILKTNGFLDLIKFLLNTNPVSLIKFSNYMKTYSAHVNSIYPKSIHLYSTGINEDLRGKGIMGNEFRNSFQYFFNDGYQKSF